ncbi:hypothetical protein OVY29_21945 [Sphingopyxis sp. SE2]|uniref:hypothetical protein n=1 Tax=Sphingopyxis sp. SE2 TaxID=1586240 RepID=UPI0028BF7ED4|nr:hypothetical protein [Sphingopyxis sp. SE2]MDT7531324.1 hypothetical protein [Sphingopyxis sp. SE2]
MKILACVPVEEIPEGSPSGADASVCGPSSSLVQVDASAIALAGDSIQATFALGGSFLGVAILAYFIGRGVSLLKVF